jgi:hypothetical protein
MSLADFGKPCLGAYKETTEHMVPDCCGCLLYTGKPRYGGTLVGKLVYPSEDPNLNPRSVSGVYTAACCPAIVIARLLVLIIFV